jgi:CheY-like chemotaxis protein
MDARPRVLIADASAEIRQLESAIAAHCGCEVEVAGEGPEVQDLLDRVTFDVFLLGSPLQVRPGVNVIHLLDGRLRDFASRTIVLTTHVEDVALLRAAAHAGVFAVLAKPFDVAVLAALIAECLRSEGSGDTVWIGVPNHVVEDVWQTD